MKKLKVVTIVGTRPEIIRLSRTMVLLDHYCDHIIIHTGQNYDYELNQVFFDDLELRRPDYFLNSASNETSPAEVIANIISSADKIFSEIHPDAILVLGDTNSCLSVIPAKRRKIPIFHMEAGNRCFDQRVPEEINRRIVDHIADINLTYSSIAREYLLREGIPPDQIIKVGSPMYEVIHHYLPKIERSDILERLNLEEGSYFVISLHREENVDSDINFSKLISILNDIADEYNIPVIVSAHPRTKNRINYTNAKFHPNIRISNPFGFLDYLKLQVSSKVVLSDSGTISEESSILNFRALNLREAHERPESMEESSVMMVGLDILRIQQCLKILDLQSVGGKRNLQIPSDYLVDNVSQKILSIIHSYTSYINRVVWKKY